MRQDCAPPDAEEVGDLRVPAASDFGRDAAGHGRSMRDAGKPRGPPNRLIHRGPVPGPSSAGHAVRADSTASAQRVCHAAALLEPVAAAAGTRTVAPDLVLHRRHRACTGIGVLSATSWSVSTTTARAVDFSEQARHGTGIGPDLATDKPLDASLATPDT